MPYSTRRFEVDRGMMQMLDIPKDRKPIKAGRICVLLGLTILLFLSISLEFGKPSRAAVENTQN
ncbi:MAG: hypothetical protein KBF27_05005 [Cypionkella sp.]|nr:hypothetical protein [Cypionkella sp.]